MSLKVRKTIETIIKGMELDSFAKLEGYNYSSVKT